MEDQGRISTPRPPEGLETTISKPRPDAAARIRALSKRGVVKGIVAPLSRKLVGSKESDRKRSRSVRELDIWKIYQKDSVVGKFSLWGSDLSFPVVKRITPRVKMARVISSNRRKSSKCEKAAVITPPDAERPRPAGVAGNSPPRC